MNAEQFTLRPITIYIKSVYSEALCGIVVINLCFGDIAHKFILEKPYFRTVERGKHADKF